MSLDMWFRGDIKNTIAALYMTNRATVARVSPTADVDAYQQGYTDALRAVAIAFGIAPCAAGLSEMAYPPLTIAERRAQVYLTRVAGSNDND